MRRRTSDDPWTRAELERILASAQTMPGQIAGIPSKLWWPAFLLVLLSTRLSRRELLALKKTDYDEASGTLSVVGNRLPLHPHAIEALRQIPPHLFLSLLPWPFDRRSPNCDTLFQGYKRLLFRADLRVSSRDHFGRLRLSAVWTPGILDRVNLSIPFTPQPRERVRSKQVRRRRKTSTRRTKSAGVRGKPRSRTYVTLQGVIVRIRLNSPRSLQRFFEEWYRPQRLPDAKSVSVEKYRGAIERLSWYCGCDVTIDALTETLVEQFLFWLKSSGKSNPTINGYRCHLLALWRHAYKKRMTEDQPRDVHKYRVAKRVPDAWSPEEVGLILEAAAKTPGQVCDIPAGDWWTALILTIYDTGLRISALMQLEAAALSYDGWLSVPAEVQKQDADQAFLLHPDTRHAIGLTMRDPRPRLFPWPYDRDGGVHILRKHYRRLLKRAGLPSGQRDLFHKLRRTSATAICNAFDLQTAQRHLGHSTVQLTKSYVDPRKLVRNHTGAESIARPVCRNGEGGSVVQATARVLPSESPQIRRIEQDRLSQ